jgi:hypothetical protein
MHYLNNCTLSDNLLYANQNFNRQLFHSQHFVHHLPYSATAINLRALDIPIGYWSKGTGPIDTAIITTLFKGINYLGIEIPALSGEMGLCRDAETADIVARYNQKDRGDETLTKKKKEEEKEKKKKKKEKKKKEEEKEKKKKKMKKQKKKQEEEEEKENEE